MTAVYPTHNSRAISISSTTSSLRMGQVAFEFELGDNEEAVIRTKCQICYTMILKKCLFGSKVRVFDSIAGEELFIAKSRSLLGYIKIYSPCFSTRIKFSRPASKGGVYGLEVLGVKYFWDYEHDCYLRCFTATEKALVAQFKYDAGEDCRKIGRLVLTRQVTHPHIQPLLILTALLFLKQKIWGSA
ncbi:hypothetical protein K493DRAFT_386859 [Basidiobolus meristosporus CBS 931.73]|uniref:Uncharacterized protein n=1 Tax=Basidiobolus meristosporus CBS 931.73 TaxID=1314790 RepID=A0A1Y1YW60_9FUNG|nr:hypothetical protein K493DRAFT_386859 [Basidiobolus meristosporus CBS 931.73]|eukprot:ORY02231.1 hypothetical protein K493DRAFT_386859 [Basidiobolus meristosporus CBS 931.73]